MSSFEENVKTTYKKGLFSKQLQLEFLCECGSKHTQEAKINTDIVNRGTKILFWCPHSHYGYEFILGNAKSNFQLRSWNAGKYDSEKGFHFFALYAKNAPMITLGGPPVESVSPEEATQDDPMINSNEFLGLSITESLEETQKAFDKGERSFDRIFHLIVLLYSDFRKKLEHIPKESVYEIPETYLSALSQELDQQPDDFSKAKAAYCYFIKNEYPQGLSLLNELDPDLPPEIVGFLTELYYFKIQNPFCIDGVIMLRPSRSRVLTIREHLENNDRILNDKYQMALDYQDKMFHFGIYQINLVLLLFLARLLNRDDEEIQFLERRINLEEFNPKLRDALLKHIE